MILVVNMSSDKTVRVFDHRWYVVQRDPFRSMANACSIKVEGRGSFFHYSAHGGVFEIFNHAIYFNRAHEIDGDGAAVVEFIFNHDWHPEPLPAVANPGVL